MNDAKGSYRLDLEPVTDVRTGRRTRGPLTRGIAERPQRTHADLVAGTPSACSRGRASIRDVARDDPSMNIDDLEFDDSGLMPRMGDTDLNWMRPEGNTADDPMRAVVAWAMDIGEQGQMVWPAARDGALQIPPPQHVLDRMVRTRIAGESAEIEAELLIRPNPGTVAVVGKLPNCDMCSRGNDERPGRYDARVTDGGRSIGASLCGDHFLALTEQRLGPGYGQYLMTREEVPEAVNVAYERAMEFWEPQLSG